jgi:hypothetical protein
MLSRKVILPIALLSFWALSFHPAFAGNECKYEDGDWNPQSIGPVVTWTAPTNCAGELTTQGYFLYTISAGVFDSEGALKPYKDKGSKSNWQQQLFCQYGITDRLEIAALGNCYENMRRIDGYSAESAGFGDTYLYARFCAVEEKGWIPCITGLFQLKLPTGKYQKLNESRLNTDYMGAISGGGSYEEGYGVIVTKRLKPFILHFDAIFGFPNLTRLDGAKTLFGDCANFDFGLEYFFYKNFNLMLEFNSFFQGDSRIDGEMSPATDVYFFNISPGFGWYGDGVRALVAYQGTLAGTNVDFNNSVIFTIEFVF